jgi:hypothetical protein
LDYKAVGIERLHYFTQDIGRLPELFCLAVKCFVIARREPDVQKFGERFGCHDQINFAALAQSVPQLIYNVQQIQNLFCKRKAPWIRRGLKGDFMNKLTTALSGNII